MIRLVIAFLAGIVLGLAARRPDPLPPPWPLADSDGDALPAEWTVTWSRN